MKAYIGTKIVQAEPCMEQDALAATGRLLAAGAENRVGYRVLYEDAYVSWSPKAVFERSYRLVTGAERALIEAQT